MAKLSSPASILLLNSDSNIPSKSSERIIKTKRNTVSSYVESLDPNTDEPSHKLNLSSFVINSKLSTLQPHRSLVELRNNDIPGLQKLSHLKLPRRKSKTSPRCKIESPQQKIKTQAGFYLSFSEALDEISKCGVRIGGCSPCAKRTNMHFS